MIPRFHRYAMFGLVLASLIVALAAYRALPDRVPTHWNIRGEIDGFGSRQTVLLMPAVQLGISLLLIVLPRLGPFSRNFDRFAQTYGRIGVVLNLAFTAIQVVIILAMLGWKFPMGSAMAVVIGLMFALLGNYMGKIRRNFYVGIRTPWTLASDEVWERTHRAGGPLFVVAGLVTAATALFTPQWLAFVVLMVCIMGSSVSVLVYSYVIYRRLRAPDDLGEPAPPPSQQPH